MRLARPPGGFKIFLSKNVRLLVEQHCGADPRFERHWSDICERLSFLAHEEGVADSRLGNGHRLLAIAGDANRDLPRIRLVYLVLGDTVHVKVAQIG